MNTPTIFTSDFNGLAIDIIDHAGKRWLTAEQVGAALGYNEANSGAGVRNLYNRHKDEFADSDTCRINLMRQGQLREVLVFSDTGCNLLSFFSNTPRAKHFRAWAKQALVCQPAVLSITDAKLERLVSAMELQARHLTAMSGDIGDAMHAMAEHGGTLALGMETVLAQLNVTDRYIGLLEQNQRGTVKVTPEICQKVREMTAAGTPKRDITRMLRISRTSVDRIMNGEYVNRVVSGPTEEQKKITQTLQEMADACRTGLAALQAPAAANTQGGENDAY